MKLLLKIIIGFLATIGAVAIAGATYLYVADPFGLKPLFTNTNTPAQELPTNTNTSVNPLLTPAQAAALEKFGINPAQLPTAITPALEQCFTAALGAARIAEIKAGAAPTAYDLYKAKSCLN